MNDFPPKKAAPETDDAGYRWPRWYALVLGALTAEILLFVYLTRLFP